MMRGALLVGALFFVACASGSPSAPAPGDAGDAGADGGGPVAEPLPGSGGPSAPGDDDKQKGVDVRSDPSVTIEPTGSSSECDGLLPSLVPAPVRVDVKSNSLQCGRAISEGGGHVAVNSASGEGWLEWQVFSSDGQREHTLYLHNDVLLPQPDGWQGARVQDRGASYESVELQTFSGDGAPRWHERATPPSERVVTQDWKLVEDPQGGSLFVFSGQVKMHKGACAGEARWFEHTGLPAGSASAIGCWHIGGAASNQGEALIVESSQRRSGRSSVHWIRRDGTHVGNPTLEGETGALFSRGGPIRFAPLLDGSIAVNDQGRWTRRYPYLAERGEAAPSWLEERSGWAYRFTRGNRGYAMFPPPGGASAGCEPRVEIRAPSGRLCGTITLSLTGAPCSSGYIDQGWDGTVVQQLGEGQCSYRWWPRLLGAD